MPAFASFKIWWNSMWFSHIWTVTNKAVTNSVRNYLKPQMTSNSSVIQLWYNIQSALLFLGLRITNTFEQVQPSCITKWLVITHLNVTLLYPNVFATLVMTLLSLTGIFAAHCKCKPSTFISYHLINGKPGLDVWRGKLPPNANVIQLRPTI